MSSSQASTSKQSGRDDTPTRTKRRYGASCELCRKRKRKCPGRDAQGKSMCTHCKEVGVQCIFPPSRAKVAMANSVNGNTEVDGLRRYIRKLAKSPPDQREILLTKWAADDEKKIALGRRMVMKKLMSEEAGIPFEDDDHDEFEEREHEPSRPNKRTRRESQSSFNEESEKGVDPLEYDSGASSTSDLSALRLSLKPEGPPVSDPEFSEGSDGEDDHYHQSPYQQTQNSYTHPGYPEFPPTYTVYPPKPPVPHAQVSAWTDHFIANTFASGAVPNVSEKERDMLLSHYFSWQGPRNCVINQAVFESALASTFTTSLSPSSTSSTSSSRYISEFLLWTLYAHTARHVPKLRGMVYQYAARAHILLAGEMARPSSISTVQGLLLLSANNAARGMYAQAWHLNASAIAMIVDLGIHLDKSPSAKEKDQPKDSPSPGSMTSKKKEKEKEKEIVGGSRERDRSSRGYIARQMRLRVFWAAFVWDKLLSLALNRTPLLSVDVHRPPLIDAAPSTALWSPYVPPPSPTPDYDGAIPPPASDPILLHTYRPQLSHEDKFFYENCRANIFLDEVHRFLYRKPWRRLPTWQVRDFVVSMREKISNWLRIADVDVVFTDLSTLQGGGDPPPPHILQLNILMRVIWILLYRPFYYSSVNSLGTPTGNSNRSNSASASASTSTSSLSSSSTNPPYMISHAVSTCEKASIEISELFKAYASAFPLAKASYVIIFAAFLAATIDLVVIERRRRSLNGDDLQEVSGRLRLCELVLKGGRGSIPGMQESMERLEKRLERVLTHSEGMEMKVGPEETQGEMEVETDAPVLGILGYPIHPQRRLSQYSQQAQMQTPPQQQSHPIPRGLQERKSLPSISQAMPTGSESYRSPSSAVQPGMNDPHSGIAFSPVYPFSSASQHYSQPHPGHPSHQRQPQQEQLPYNPSNAQPPYSNAPHGPSYVTTAQGAFFGDPNSSVYAGVGGVTSMPIEDGWNAWFWPGDSGNGQGISYTNGVQGNEPQNLQHGPEQGSVSGWMT